MYFASDYCEVAREHSHGVKDWLAVQAAMRRAALDGRFFFNMDIKRDEYEEGREGFEKFWEDLRARGFEVAVTYYDKYECWNCFVSWMNAKSEESSYEEDN